MTRTSLALDGPQRTLREALGETWRWYVGAPLPAAGNNVADAAAAVAVAPGWLPAHVPCSQQGGRCAPGSGCWSPTPRW